MLSVDYCPSDIGKPKLAAGLQVIRSAITVVRRVKVNFNMYKNAVRTFLLLPASDAVNAKSCTVVITLLDRNHVFPIISLRRPFVRVSSSRLDQTG